MKQLIAIIALAFASFTLHAETPTTPTSPPGQTSVTAPAAPVAPVAPAATAPLVVQRREEEDGKPPGLAARVKAFMNRDGGATMQAQLQQLIEEKATLQQQLTAARDELARHATERAEIEQALTEQRNVVKATATTIAATMGVPLESLPAPRSAEQAQNKITRAEFDQMNHAQKNEFFQKGGTFRAE